MLNCYNDFDDYYELDYHDNYKEYNEEYDNMIYKLLKNMKEYIHDNALYLGEKINYKNLENFINSINSII